MRNDTIFSGMVDVGGKGVTARRATATAEVVLGAGIFQQWQAQGSPKGDVLATARVAGVLAAKQTPAAIPFCHPLPLNKVDIGFAVDAKAAVITVTSEVACEARTGVEMEALHAAAVAALTIYDMLKCFGKGIEIRRLCLLAKTGGKSGDYQRESGEESTGPRDQGKAS